MPQTRKIANCCYCGARSVLLLDKVRHELSCSACGAPLHEMKFMPVEPKQRPELQKIPVSRKRPEPRKKKAPYRSEKYKDREKWDERKRYEKKVYRKRKSFSHKVFEELWDVVEDIFD